MVGTHAAFHTLGAQYGVAAYWRLWAFVGPDAVGDGFPDVLAKSHKARRRLSTVEHARRWLRNVIRESTSATANHQPFFGRFASRFRSSSLWSSSLGRPRDRRGRTGALIFPKRG